MKHSCLLVLTMLIMLSSCKESSTAPPAPEGSIRFDGSYGSFVHIPQVLDSSTQKFTVMFWFRVDSVFQYSGSDFTKLIAFVEGRSTKFMFSLLPQSLPPSSPAYIMTGYNRLNDFGTEDVVRFTQWSSDPPLANTWSHVALSYASSDGTQGPTDSSAMYLNGNAVQQYAMRDEEPFHFRIPASSMDSINVGIRTLGSIAHLAIYNRQLSRQEIRDRFKKTLTPSQETGLVGYWPLEKDVKDYSGRGIDGTLVGKGAFVMDSPF